VRTGAKKPLLLVALSTLLLGCSSGDLSSGSSAVRDSLGIRIVENGEASAGEWSVADEPLFTVGWEEGGPMFTWPQSGLILPDGGALIGEFQDGMIYRIGADGTVVETWGRKGEGPGEYQALDAILLRGDSILVSDGRMRRVTILAPDGNVRTTSQPGSFLHQASAILSDGRLLFVPGDGYGMVAETTPGWVFETQPILAVDLERETVDTLADLPHLRRWYATAAGSPGPINVVGRAGGFSEGFAWARSDRPEVHWYDESGSLVQIARWDEEPMPLSSEWRDRMARIYEESYLSRGADEAFVADQLAELDVGLDRHGGPLPYWRSFVVDRQGNAWLSEYDVAGEPSTTWRVIDRDGRMIGWIELPGVMAILDITDDRVLTMQHDELEVPALVMLALFKE
jgi:hypothetical protein